MSYTYTTAIGDGVTKIFNFSFAGQDTGYLSTSNIYVFVAGSQISDFSILPTDPNKVYLKTAPALGAEILIRRIMPKNVPYADFKRGNPFSQDTLNNTNLQMLYNLQEVFDGYLPIGFFFRQDIDMHGYKLVNLGEGVDDTDSVNKHQLDEQAIRVDEVESRVTSLEDNLIVGDVANYIAQVVNVTSDGLVTINTTNNLPCIALYINGLFQHKIAGSYTQIAGVITLAEPLRLGSQVYLILGTTIPASGVYATIESLAALELTVSLLNSDVEAVDNRLVTVEGDYAKRGSNIDITSLGGLTTPLSTGQGGTGNNSGNAESATKLLTARSLITNLASTSSANFDGTANNSHGVTGTLPLANGGLGATTAAGGRAAIGAAASSGVTDASNASSGVVGEVITATTSATSITTGVITQATSIALTAGDWEVTGCVRFNTTTATFTALLAGISTVAGTITVFPSGWETHMSYSPNSNQTSPHLSVRINVAANTTIYLNAQCAFATGTVTVDGYLKARRVR